MFYLEGSQAVLKNAVILSHRHIGGGAVRNREGLRDAYLGYLASVAEDQDYMRYLQERRAVDGAEPHFTGDEAVVSILGRVFGNPDPEGGAQYAVAPLDRVRRCREGWQYLVQRDSSFVQVASLLTHTVFTVSASWTGSMSDRKAIGSILLIPGEGWERNDVAEAIIHEFTHTALFMDERVSGHFHKGADEVVLESAIRKDERTLPAVVHSLLVAVEILSWRRNQGLVDEEFRLHGPTPDLVRKAQGSYKSLVDTPEWHAVVKDRVAALVEAAGKRLETF